MFTPQLLELAKTYLAIVDSGDESRQDTERTQAHDDLMWQMELEHVPFNSRFEARWIARWIVAGAPEPNYETRVMFARVAPSNAVYELFFTPPDDNCAGLIPVLCTLQPFTAQSPIAEL